MSYATNLTTEELADQLTERVSEAVRKGMHSTFEEYNDAIYDALCERRAAHARTPVQLDQLADLIRRT